MLQGRYDERLEYVNQYCIKCLNTKIIDPETGEAYPFAILDEFIKRYNHLEMNEADFRKKYKHFTIPQGMTFEKYKQSISMNGTFTYKDYQEDKNFQELLHDKRINFDPEKFWYLLRFIYDYTWGQCVNGLKLKESSAVQLNKFSEAVAANYDTFRPKPKQTLILYTANKTCAKIDSYDAIQLLAQLWDAYKSSIRNPLLEARYSTEAILTESNGVLAFFSAKMFVNFFAINSMDKKKGAKLSDKQKELISCFWYFTGIVSNISVLISTEYFKAIWKRYKNYEPQSINAYYV